MPGLTLFAASPPLLSAVLALAAPVQTLPAEALPPPPPPAEWSLAPPPESAEPRAPPPDSENDIVVEGKYGPPKVDPIERFNAESYRITQEIDEAFVEPVAYAYRDGLPGPIRDGLGNVVRNLGEPSNALNFLLQGKVGKAFKTMGRLAINSTVGVGGLIDVAGKRGVGLPYRRNGFANTMGFYGIGSGPYLYLPFTGATSVRDVIGSGLDQLLLPVVVGRPFNRPEFAAPYFLVNSLDARLAVDAELATIRASDDPYAVRRDTYLARRKREIAVLKGKAVEPSPAAEPAAPLSDLSLPERLQLSATPVPQDR